MTGALAPDVAARLDSRRRAATGLADGCNVFFRIIVTEYSGTPVVGIKPLTTRTLDTDAELRVLDQVAVALFGGFQFADLCKVALLFRFQITEQRGDGPDGQGETDDDGAGNKAPLLGFSNTNPVAVPSNKVWALASTTVSARPPVRRTMGTEP